MMRPDWKWTGPRAVLLFALAGFSYTRFIAYWSPTEPPEPLPYGLDQLSNFLPLSVYALLWALSGFGMIYCAVTRTRHWYVVGWVGFPPFVWAMCYALSATHHYGERDGPVAVLFLMMAIVFVSACMVLPKNGWSRRG